MLSVSVRQSVSLFVSVPVSITAEWFNHNRYVLDESSSVITNYRNEYYAILSMEICYLYCPFKSVDKTTKSIKYESHVLPVITIATASYNEVTKFIETHTVKPNVVVLLREWE